MRKLTLFLLLTGLSVICFGQNYKCSKCGSTKYDMIGTIKTIPVKSYYKCEKCGNIDEFPSIKGKPIIKINRFDKEFKKADSVFDYRNSKIYISTNDNGYSGLSYTFNPVKTKLMLSSTGVVTINIDEFKVVDTIWIQAGKKRTGIPAYKFLEYFKEDYPTLTSPLWNGGSYIRGL